MSEELEVVEPTVPEIETVEPISLVDEPIKQPDLPSPTVEPARSKHEDLAIAKGWKPLDSFDGDKDEWRPAKEWLDRGDLLDTIHGLKQKLKDQGDSLEHLVEFNKKIEEKTRERTIAELEEKHRAAIEIGDVEAATKAAKAMITATQESLAPAKPKDSSQEIDPAVHAFVSRHGSWFNDNSAENSAMKAFAIKRDSEIVSQHPGIKPGDALLILESDLKRTFPAKFASAPVSAVAAPTAPAPKTREAAIPEYHRKMISKLERTLKGFDKEAYIKTCREIGEF